VIAVVGLFTGMLLLDLCKLKIQQQEKVTITVDENNIDIVETEEETAIIHTVN
jgi:uncharacterized membrane-anchored protein YhcB (DUF1043 family)